MSIVLDHTIVPAKDKLAAAKFFAEVFGLAVKPGDGYFAQVQINESLTFDFADDPAPRSHHYAFHISEAEFDAIFARVKARGLAYAVRPTIIPTVKRMAGAAGGASILKIRTAICWKS